MATQKVDLGKKGSFSIHKGALHRALGLAEGKKIPETMLTSALHASKPRNGFSAQKIRDMARSAKGLKAMAK